MNAVQYPPQLSKEEEMICLEACNNGCAEAKNTLIQHNLRLVAYLAHKFTKDYDVLEELISIGTFGLIKAVDTFDTERNIKFATYASKCIQNEILMSFRKHKNRKDDSYLEETVTRDSEGNEMSLMDTIGTDDDLVEQDIMRENDIRILYSLLQTLPSRERTIIEKRYGIGRKPMLQCEVAQEMNISQSYVSRIEKKVLRQLQHGYSKKTAI
ncbi:sigma-70 family RNA polymerase sigma factor (plasmid) [Pontibacillus sp. ALD_SL1]|uniref:sigma-70 family RNA polymerase sigma factor n=1 Tax=Pontibacillus sp. ALD_SL1 TaxID=2777185 RepID=UPI001A97B24B|nr:sigma-70 family RNA polymerase sigma factor [Pontibacillus sp. ALD_SL1]QST02776.1 sigma-70 family RNA polymerase sigma factor [Pontibacillus sp. ALD_SL1]